MYRNGQARQQPLRASHFGLEMERWAAVVVVSDLGI